MCFAKLILKKHHHCITPSSQTTLLIHELNKIATLSVIIPLLLLCRCLWYWLFTECWWRRHANGREATAFPRSDIILSYNSYFSTWGLQEGNHIFFCLIFKQYRYYHVTTSITVLPLMWPCSLNCSNVIFWNRYWLYILVV